MRCPNCSKPVCKPRPGTVWRYCEACRGWFYWDRTPISGLIIDLLETLPGCWHTQNELCDLVDGMRPGINPESVRRSIRVLKSRGHGLAADRIILTSSSGGERLGPKRPVLIEAGSTDGQTKIRVADFRR